MDRLYVQYGCGFSAPEGWENFDASLTVRFERTRIIGKLFTKNERRFPERVRYGDVVKGLPVADGSVDGIYASHVLEHLALDDFHTALRNTWRLLKPGGIFRLIVPDLRWRVDQYIHSSNLKDPDANAAFLLSCHLGAERSPKNLWGLATEAFGHSRHLWMWDEPAMRHALETARFEKIRRAEIGDAKDPMFSKVEEENRFFDCGRPELAMECAKPA